MFAGDWEGVSFFACGIGRRYGRLLSQEKINLLVMMHQGSSVPVGTVNSKIGNASYIIKKTGAKSSRKTFH